MPDRIITIRGRRWRLIEGSPGRGCDGQCSPPTLPGKTITIPRRVRRNRRHYLRILLHECMHAGLWDLDETTIDDLSTDLARILEQEGFCQTTDR